MGFVAALEGIHRTERHIPAPLARYDARRPSEAPVAVSKYLPISVICLHRVPR